MFAYRPLRLSDDIRKLTAQDALNHSEDPVIVSATKGDTSPIRSNLMPINLFRKARVFIHRKNG